MAIQKEIWIDSISEKLFAGNDFINLGVSHDMFVSNKTVHIPQAGTIPAVVKDRAILPSTISQRTDTDKSYTLGQYTTDAMLITDLEELQVNYDKRSSVLDQHTRKVGDRLGLEALYQWAGATLKTAGGTGQIVLTTGTATAGIAPPSGTGNRKSIALADLANAASKLDEDDVPREGRYLIIPSVVYWDMLENLSGSLLNSDYMNKGNLPTGVVANILDFNIITRSYTVAYADAATPTKKTVGAAGAATDHWGCVGFQADAVARALGEIKVFAQEDVPEYYGSIFSAEVNFAATQLRSDAKGIVTIVQDS